MWILFSPSEKKCLEHKKAQEKQGKSFFKDFICKEGLEEALKAYVAVLKSGKESEIKHVFGVKEIDLKELAIAQNIMESPLLPTILRYIGVAFSALDFENLHKNAQDYLNKRLLIFSNLFGALRADDRIPYYDLKQGAGFQHNEIKFNTRQFYSKNASKIWEYLTNNLDSKISLEILDLRAGFYQKCFCITKIPPNLAEMARIIVYEPIFIKNGKVVSHYAKHYRGILLKEIAMANLQNLADLDDFHINGLELESIKETQKGKLKHRILTYQVL